MVLGLNDNIFNCMKKDPVRTKRRNLKRSAKSRGLAFDLSTDDVAELLSTRLCYYTGRELNDDNFSIDRKDCSKGYVDGNVVACCKDANNLKSQLLENPDTRFPCTELIQLFSKFRELIA